MFVSCLVRRFENSDYLLKDYVRKESFRGALKALIISGHLQPFIERWLHNCTEIIRNSKIF